MKSFKSFVAPNNIYYHVTLTSNVSNIMKYGLKPSVGDRSQKMNEKPSIFLFKTYEDMENAMMNWLGDEFDESPTTLLKVNLPNEIKVVQGASFEYQVFDYIHPNYIENLGEI